MKLRLASRVVKGKVGSFLNVKKPLIVKLTLLNSCNLKCKYCNSPLRKPMSYSIQEVIEIINTLSSLGTARITFTGGEPLLREDVEDILKITRKKGIYTSLITNGVLFPEKYEKIKNYIDQLIVSFDGPKKVHETHRGKGTFRYVIETLKIARENKINTWTITVLTNRNSDKKTVNFVLKKAKKYNFKAVFQVVSENRILGRNYESLLSDSKTYRKIFLHLIKKKKNGYPVGSSLFYLKRMAEWKDFRVEKLHRHGEKCYAGKLFFNIDVDRKIYPCSLLVGSSKGVRFSPKSIFSAIKKIGKPPCNVCRMSCYTEYNGFFSLNPLVMSNMKSFINLHP